LNLGFLAFVDDKAPHHRMGSAVITCATHCAYAAHDAPAARGMRATSVANRQRRRVVKTQRRAHVRRTPRSRSCAVDISAGSGVICTANYWMDLLIDRRRVDDVMGAKRVRARESHCMAWNAAPVS
jgi:hypothetical protein